jgi:hypothetical protein
MAVEGTLGVFRLPEILQLIAQQGKTGILTVQGQHDIVAISFLRGDIVAADALNQPAEEGLERVLVGGGLVRREEFARAAAEAQTGSGRLIDMLVERRLLSRDKLLEALRLQTFRLLEQLLLWQEGDFKFYSGDEVSFEEGFAPIRVQDLLLRSVEDLEEAQKARPTPVPAAAAPRVVPPAGGPSLLRPVAVPRPVPVAPPARGAPAEPPAAPAPPEPPREERARPAPPLRYVRVEPEAPAPAAPPAWPAGLLAAALAALLAAGAVLSPRLVVLPYPWQAGERAAVESGQRAALLAKLDRAAKTFFLLEGRFPETLAQLRARGLLAPADLLDPQGRPFRYEPGTESYVVDSTAAGGSIRGNFQLDPEFLSAGSDRQAEPLVLLD